MEKIKRNAKNEIDKKLSYDILIYQFFDVEFLYNDQINSAIATHLQN